MNTASDSGGFLEPAIDTPPRYWWLKRILIAAGVALVLMTGLRIWWGVAAGRALQRTIAELRAAGYGVYPEDADWEFEGDSAGVAAWRDVTTGVSGAANDWYVSDYYDANTVVAVGDVLGDPNNIESVPDIVAGLIEIYAEPLAMLREAREAENGDWDLPWGNSGIAAAAQDSVSWRYAAKAAGDAALWAAHHGEHSEVVEYVRDIVAVERAQHQRRGLMIDHLVAVANGRLAALVVRRLGPGLIVEPHEAPDEHHAVARAQVESLIEELLDDSAALEGWRAAMHRERHYVIERVEMLRSMVVSSLTVTAWFAPRPPARWKTWMMRVLAEPAWVADCAGGLGGLVEIERIGRERFWTGSPVDHDWGFGRGDALSLLEAFGVMREGSCARASGLVVTARAHKRAAALLLSLRMFELDRGHLPATLDVLVPDYIDELPADPFSRDGETFGYRPELTPPLLYSRGENGTDNGGVENKRTVAGDLGFGAFSSEERDPSNSDILFPYGKDHAQAATTMPDDSPRPVPDDDRDIQRDPNHADNDQGADDRP